ncbi:MAG: signal peptidase II [Myxococcota bacterium]
MADRSATDEEGVVPVTGAVVEPALDSSGDDVAAAPEAEGGAALEGSPAPAALFPSGAVLSSGTEEPAPPSVSRSYRPPPIGSTPPARSAKPFRTPWLFLGVMTVLNLVSDLGSKWWAKSTFEAVKPGGERERVIFEGFSSWEFGLNFIFAKNKGGAWGLFQNELEILRRPFFLTVSMAAIIFILTLYRKLQPGQSILKWGLALVFGGALGNLVDRIRYGYVVDFIDIHAKLPGWVNKLGMSPGESHWPTFNVADIAICVGVVFMAIDMFSTRSESGEEAATKPASVPDVG